jgi:hypothetical protein
MKFRWPNSPIPKWLLKRMDEDIAIGMFQAHMDGSLDEVTDRLVYRTLLVMRTRRAIAPYLYVFKLGWEIVRGKYWRTAKKVHGDPDEASGGSPGAGIAPVTQFTFATAGAVYPGYTSTSTSTSTISVTGAGYSGLTHSIPATSPDFENAGIKAGEITAYRCWKLREDGLLGSCVVEDHIWQPGKPAEGDAAGGLGIYAFKSVLLLSEYGNPDPGYVTGTVDMWGDVFEHERGYRAQYAAISSIDDSCFYDAAALRKRYKLPAKRVRKKK